MRVTSLTSSDQLIATILEKYKIEMGAANFALYVIKDNGGKWLVKCCSYYQSSSEVKFWGKELAVTEIPIRMSLEFDV